MLPGKTTLWCAAAGLMLTGQAALASSINVSKDFSGDATTNWGFDSTTDPNSQLSGTGHLTYTYAASDAESYLTSTIDDASTVFPSETGTMVMKFQLDLSKYQTHAGEYVGPAVVSINSSGNQGALSTQGMIADFALGGWNSAGQLRFETNDRIVWYGTGQAGSGAFTPPTDTVAHPLIYNVVWTVGISGSESTSWTVTSSATVTGPTDAAGDITTKTVPVATYSKAYSGFHGWSSATGYSLGVDPATSTGGPVAAGNAITINSFSAAAQTPEPASLALLALGGLALLPGLRRQRA